MRRFLLYAGVTVQFVYDISYCGMAKHIYAFNGKIDKITCRNDQQMALGCG